MQTVIIGVLVIVVPMIAYCVGTVMRDNMYAKEAGSNGDGVQVHKNIPVTKDTKWARFLRWIRDGRFFDAGRSALRDLCFINGGIAGGCLYGARP